MEKIRLRGNTFIVLLLRSGVPELKNKPEWNEDNDGVTRPNLFADLLKMTSPGYKPKNIKSLSTSFSNYLKGETPYSPMYFPFNTPAFQNGLSIRINEEYDAVLDEMDKFCKKYLKTDDIDQRLLVAGLVDAIIEDDTFYGRFDVGEKWIEKDGLNKESTFLLQPFLVSVWNNILLHHPNAKEGASTYSNWTEYVYMSPDEITTNIGVERAKRITVSDDLPAEVFSEPPIEEAAEKNIKSMPEDKEQKIIIEETQENQEPRVEVYEAPFINPDTQQQVVAQFHVEAKDNGIAIGQVFGGLVIGKREKDE